MSVNRERPHVFVLPEDDANRQIAVGFTLELSSAVERRIQVLRPEGGWRKVLESFTKVHITEMNGNEHRFMILLIDFDEDADRLTVVRRDIPSELLDRVFVLGAWSEPEKLRSAGLGSYESIGSKLAEDCREDGNATWSHALLQHNFPELSRLRERVRPILFP